MPEIRPYTSQISVSSDIGIPVRNARPEAFGAGPGLTQLGGSLESVGQDTAQAQRTIQENDSRNAVTDVHTMLSRAQAEYTKRAAEFERSADPKDQFAVSRFMNGTEHPDDPAQEGSLNWYLQSYRESIQDAYALRAFDVGAEELRTRFTQHMVAVQARLAGAYAKQQGEQMVDNAQTTVMTDPGSYQDVLTKTLRAFDDPRSLYARVPAADREPMKRHAKEQIGKAYVQGVIREDPQVALELLSDGSWDSMIKGEDKPVLMRAAETRIRAQEVEAARAEAELNRQRINLARDSEGFLLQKLAINMEDPKQPPLTAKDVLASPLIDLDPPKAKSLLELIHAWGKEDPNKPIKTDPDTYWGLFRDINRPYGDPKKLLDEQRIINAGIQHKLSRADFNALRKEFEDARTVEGQRLGEEKTNFLSTSKHLIDQSNPLMGKLDKEGGQRFGQFTYFVNREIERYRKENKDPHQLFNPDSSDYLGKHITRFQKTMMESLGTVQENLRRQPSKQVEPRREGESPEEYLKRTQPK